jgi:phenylacetate-CoA ligase
MNLGKYNIFNAYNYLNILCNRPKMQHHLAGLHHYHKSIESIDYTKTKELLLNEILAYSNKYCPYYEKLYEKNNIDKPNIDSLTKIPFLDKENIKANYTSLQSRNIKKVTNYIMNTGGTTGSPLTFPVSSHYEYEHHEFAFKLFGYKKGDIIVSFDGTNISEDNIRNNIYWGKTSRSNLPYGKTSFSTVYLSNETASAYIKKLNSIKPNFIRGYPTAINYLAIYMLENNLRFDFPLKGVFLTAETIFSNQISNIKKAFKCPISLEYGHSEVSVFAYTVDDTYEYYCSPFYGYTEIIGPDGKHVNFGETGEIVVTGFYNKAMPFIRYRTSDMAVYNGNKDGIVRLKRIDGRTQDFILDINGDKIFLVGLIYGGHHDFLNHIKKWQIIQYEYGKISIKIVRGNNFSDKDRISIEALFFGMNEIKSTIEFVDEIGFTSRGKNKFVIQNVTA